MSKLDEFKENDELPVMKSSKKILKKSIKQDIFEWILTFMIAFIIAIFFRYFVGTPTKVQKISMYPTLCENDRLILNRLTKTFNEKPEHGDIITFEAPSVDYVAIEDANLHYPVATYGNEPNSLFGKLFYYALDVGKVTYIKRVIGLPGDHIEIKKNKVFLNGEELKEEYLDSSVLTNSEGGVFLDIVVPENHVYALGDNRPNSKDCRHFGCIPYDKIEGKIVFRITPFNKFGKI